MEKKLEKTAKECEIDTVERILLGEVEDAEGTILRRYYKVRIFRDGKLIKSYIEKE
jgi:hypothetical protein